MLQQKHILKWFNNNATNSSSYCFVLSSYYKLLLVAGLLDSAFVLWELDSSGMGMGWKRGCFQWGKRRDCFQYIL